MHMITNYAVMINRAGRVKDAIVADNCPRINRDQTENHIPKPKETNREISDVG